MTRRTCSSILYSCQYTWFALIESSVRSTVYVGCVDKRNWSWVLWRPRNRGGLDHIAFGRGVYRSDPTWTQRTAQRHKHSEATWAEYDILNYFKYLHRASEYFPPLYRFNFAHLPQITLWLHQTSHCRSSVPCVPRSSQAIKYIRALEKRQSSLFIKL